MLTSDYYDYIKRPKYSYKNQCFASRRIIAFTVPIAIYARNYKQLKEIQEVELIQWACLLEVLE